MSLHDKFRTSPLKKHAEALGHLCIVWGWLELTINAFLYELMSADDASAVVVLNMEFRERLRTIKALAFHRHPSSDWCKNVHKEIETIDGELRNERNRMVHDTWHANGSEALRITQFAKVKNVQAFQRTLSFGEEKTISPEDIQVLNIKIVASMGKMMHLHGVYHKLRDASPDKPQ